MNTNHKSSVAGKKARIVIIGAFAFAAAVLLIIGLPYITTGTKSDITVRIPANATIENVKDTLIRYAGKDYASRTCRLISLQATPLDSRHGSYELPKGMSPLKAARKLTKGGQTPVKLVINGFRDRKEMARRIAAKLDFSEDDLLEAMSDTLKLARYGLTPEQAPALFLNDTYEVYWSSTPGELLDKLGNHYSEVWNQMRQGKAAKLGLSPADIVVISSIVDEETNAKEEKGKVGRLYINRLQKGMRLQADPTVRFAANDFSIRRVTRKHLDIKSPYNTYLIKGLPPGPIRTVGVETIDAVLNSSPSEDLYMCAKEDFSGRHNFASDYATHQANAARYRKALDERGIK